MCIFDSYLSRMIVLGSILGFLSGSAMADEHEGRGGGGQPKNDFNIMMNYELGMHCTGFEFAYCCVLPPYNSILAQVVKTQQSNRGEGAFAKLLEGDPNVGKDILNRQTVLRDADLGPNREFQKYVMTYEHEAQPRNDGRGKPQVSTLISAVEGNSLYMWATVYDQAAKNPDGSLVTGTYNGATGVVIGDGVIDGTIADSYANGWMNHLYIYASDEHPTPAGPNLEGFGKTGIEADKIRLGVDVIFQPDCGPAGHPMGPVTKVDPFDPENTATKANDCGGLANGNLLTFSEDTGTIVYTQMKVLEDLPVTLTSPRIWEALGLPLTPFEDTINFFGDPGAVDEDAVRPYVAMKASLHEYPSGNAVTGSNGEPVIGFGTAPIDIPNCERCHSNAPDTPNSPQTGKPEQWTLVQSEYNFWNAFYDIDTAAGDSDWYSRLKSAAVSMLADHDAQHGTSFTAFYPACGGVDPVNPQDCLDLNAGIPIQNTRMGHESVICQKCHADNVIAVVKSATGPEGQLIRPISEAIHRNHRSVTEINSDGEPGVITFNDSLGRDGGCQGCHPAHRSDGDMEGYPITLTGENFYADGDNRLASGGCFVGRDVHSNPFKDIDGAETPEHLNAVGEWLRDNVFYNQAGLTNDDRDNRGIWCTNCHTQLSQEIWKAEDCDNLIEGDCVNNVRGLGSLLEIAQAIGSDLATVESWLDPKGASGSDPGGQILSVDGIDRTHDIWRAADPNDPRTQDANVATIEVNLNDGPVVTFDADGDPSVNILSFCTTPDCVESINANKDDPSQWRHPTGNTFTDSVANTAVAVPFSAATDGRDHWLSPGEPHCADCHAAPYVEQSGNINAFAPFNYPAKAGLMRYSRGHRDITCQGCHESIHGLYPVTPDIDTTSYAQAASMNSDDSHGPLKCGACHQVNSSGVHERMDDLVYDGQRVRRNLDAAIGWAHTFTEEKSPLDNMCVNCHDDERDQVRPREEEWQEHAMRGRASRKMMDQVELELLGAIAGTDPNTGEADVALARNGVCRACHSDEFNEVSCDGSDGREWKRHLSEGRVAMGVPCVSAHCLSSKFSMASRVWTF